MKTFWKHFFRPALGTVCLVALLVLVLGLSILLGNAFMSGFFLGLGFCSGFSLLMTSYRTAIDRYEADVRSR